MEPHKTSLLKLSIEEVDIPTPILGLGDERHITAREIKSIAERYSRLVSDSDLELTYKYYGDFAFFNPVSYDIDGVEYTIGYKGYNGVTAGIVGSFLINKNKESAGVAFIENFRNRLIKIAEQKREQFIKNEIFYVKENIEIGKSSDDPIKHGLYNGYANEGRALVDFTFLEPFTFASYQSTLKGAATHNYLEYLESLLLAEKEDLEFIQSGGLFKNNYEIVLFFKYAGIYDTLYSRLNNDGVSTAKAIALLAGLSEEKGKSLRPLFSVCGTYNPNNEMSRKLFKIANIDNTIERLESMGLETAELCKIRNKIKN